MKQTVKHTVHTCEFQIIHTTIARKYQERVVDMGLEWKTKLYCVRCMSHTKISSPFSFGFKQFSDIIRTIIYKCYYGHVCHLNIK